MFDIGLGKPLVIFIIALLVIGPEKLPGTARTIGVLLRRMRVGWDHLQREVEHDLSLRQLGTDVAAGTKQISNSLALVPHPIPNLIDVATQRDDSHRSAPP